jgi:hypothetical protein
VRLFSIQHMDSMGLWAIARNHIALLDVDLGHGAILEAIFTRYGFGTLGSAVELTWEN